jgi:hypothetical protein
MFFMRLCDMLQLLGCCIKIITNVEKEKLRFHSVSYQSEVIKDFACLTIDQKWFWPLVASDSIFGITN